MNLDYIRIEKAIEFINTKMDEQPTLNDIAEYVGLSEAHFQRVFSRWASL